jgi:hypothetical protein
MSPHFRNGRISEGKSLAVIAAQRPVCDEQGNSNVTSRQGCLFASDPGRTKANTRRRPLNIDTAKPMEQETHKEKPLIEKINQGF